MGTVYVIMVYKANPYKSLVLNNTTERSGYIFLWFSFYKTVQLKLKVYLSKQVLIRMSISPIICPVEKYGI